MDKPKFYDVRMKGFKERADVSEMWRLIDERVFALGSEEVGLADAFGRSLAEPVVAAVAVPGFDRAAMDGYALRGEETFGAGQYNELAFQVVGQSMPGAPSDATVQTGQAVRIMTGAPMPKGADAVVMVEYTREDGQTVWVSEAVPPHKNVGRVGEDVALGTQVLTPPRALRPQDLAVCAAIGTGVVRVVRRPKVAIVVTGDELLPAGEIPSGSQIVDTNSVMLRALVEREGCRVDAPQGKPIPILPDDRERICQRLLDCDADCLLISGGSSVGKEDHAPSLLAELGELCIHGLALRPASPAGLGFLAGKPVFLMPGNPVSCLCAFDLFAGRALRLLAGKPADDSRRCKTRLPLCRKISSASGRVDYVRVKITEGGVEPLAISGASILSSTTRADGFVLVPKDLEGYASGAMVEVTLY